MSNLESSSAAQQLKDRMAKYERREIHYHLIAKTVVTVEVGREKFRARAAQVYGAERTRLFDAAAKLVPLFTDNQNITKREIPVLTLTRLA